MVEPFLRIPPFPGSRTGPLAISGTTPVSGSEATKIAQLLKESRVGGNFWGDRPRLPAGRDLVLAPSSRAQALVMIGAATEENVRDRCIIIDSIGVGGLGNAIPTLNGSIDLWHLSESAADIWADANHELALIARLRDQPIRIFGEDLVNDAAERQSPSLLVGEVIGAWSYRNPFDGQTISPIEAIQLLADWRHLIDRNRAISTVLGVASWKRPTVDAMLWDGTARPRYSSDIPEPPGKESMAAAWKSRTSINLLDRIARLGLPLAEIEDGMIRGRGLGANCIPPLSIVVDFTGIYFDPTQPSDLEQLLETADMSPALLHRAARLRQMIVDAGISKYEGASGKSKECPSGRRVLVLGQVEDDRSVLNGGPGQTNLGLLRRARELEADAWLIYRPHPDVEAGHRKGHIPDQHVLEYADAIERGGSISGLIDTVDRLHCITSLGGFEALLRGKQVTTHGVPFYSGWGLTEDLGPIPSRRCRRRNLDELVAAALILYPTYLDPMTGLPCPPEVLVDRIARGEDSIAAPLAWLRSSQGKLRVALRRIWEAAA